MNTHLYYMQQALEIAQRGRDTVSPNPMVGCVIVLNDEIVGRGWHQRPGEPHAETIALNQAQQQAHGANVYLTLEPCCHTGKTPPCADALIKAGVNKVYIATLDPNPLVNQGGVAALKQAGIEVEVGLCEKQARQLNQIFFHYMLHKKPFVIAKWAMSLDGKMQVCDNDAPQISASTSQQQVHQLRQRVDAILVGANTIKYDNPRLTVRYSKDTTMVKQPLRIVLSTKAELSPQSRVFNGELPGKTLLVTTENATSEQLKQFNPKYVEILQVPATDQGLIDLSVLLTELAKRDISSLLVEGGRYTHELFMEAELINQLQVYVAPKLIGHFPQKKTVAITQFQNCGDDYFFEANFSKEE